MGSYFETKQSSVGEMLKGLELKLNKLRFNRNVVKDRDDKKKENEINLCQVKILKKRNAENRDFKLKKKHDDELREKTDRIDKKLEKFKRLSESL